MTAIPCQLHETVISTSDLVKENLRQGRTPPFAIAARKQSGGRGSRGRHWASPRGNLYLSLAFPPLPEAKLYSLSTLKTAALVCEWLQWQWKISCRIKWPNDIVFAGRKLAGILCESHTGDQGLGPIVVGIGINLITLPQEEPGALCLQDILGRPPGPLESLVHSLTDHLATYWQALCERSELLQVHDYVLDDGQPWMSEKDGSYSWQKSLGSCGDLCLTQEGKSQRKLSAHHDLKWGYGYGFRATPVVIVDMGSTQMKLAAYGHWQEQKPQFFLAVPIDGEWFQKAFEKLRQWFERRSIACSHWTVFGQGNPKGWKLLQATITSPWCLQRLSKRRLLTFGSYPLEKIGADRLAQMESFRATQGNRAGLLISLGTAITMDLVTDRGEHLGGLIQPGLQMGLEALHQRIDHLPELEEVEIRTLGLGENPRTAINQGLVTMVHATADRLAHNLAVKHSHQAEVQVVWTGGSGREFARLTDDRSWSVPVNQSFDLHAVVNGLRLLAVGGRLPQFKRPQEKKGIL